LKTKDARLQSFKGLVKGRGIEIDLVEDLLLLDIGTDEKLQLIAHSEAPNAFALELFLVSLMTHPVQDIATFAMRQWADRTDHLCWYRLLALLKEPILPQRSLYTILDLAEYLGGQKVLDLCLLRDGLEDMSVAFHGLILHRSVQFNTPHPRLGAIAGKVLSSLPKTLHPENKALPSALAYALRFDDALLEPYLKDHTTSESWVDLLMLASRSQGKKEKHPPLLWQRQKLQTELVTTAKRWQDLAGVEQKKLVDFVSKIDDPVTLAETIQVTLPLLGKPLGEKVYEALKSALSTCTDPASFLTKLPSSLRFRLSEGTKKGTPSFYARIEQEEQAFLSSTPPREVLTYRDATQGSVEAPSERRRFFNLAMRGQSVELPEVKKDFFSLLLHAWAEPDIKILGDLAQVARKEEGILRLCYIQTLGRFRGRDEACLKLLDYIRSTEDDDLRAVVKALADIGTPRAGQEIIAMLSRPNLSLANQLEAVSALSRIPHRSLQSEIKAAIAEIESRPSSDPGLIQLRDMLREQLTLTPDPSPAKVIASPVTDDSDQGLDEELKRKISAYPTLSGEVRRALRTAQFFHNKVHSDNAPGTIDLSPVIDMQYKALELFFRENFEEPCSKLISRGVLQNKLDVIGYARPIPHAMDDFERYISQLPIIKTIPFFSGFKLRKMLRAICQFRPGKRFTLDGIKAFALFFLCFSRKECRYHLQSLFPLDFTRDEDLFTFVRELHLMQDFRNRAAHEGFHPEAANDIEGIWKSTASILEIGTRMNQFIQSSAEREFAPVNRSSPIVEKKVS
jgi:hypothetical protein